MSHHHSPASSESELSELYDSVFPDSQGRASDCARMRELRKRALNEGINVAAHLPLVTPNMLFPNKRRRTMSPDRSTTLYGRIDAIGLAFKENKLSLADYIRKTCAYNYSAERQIEDPGFQLSGTEAEEAEDVRRWAREIACQHFLHEAKQMEAQHLLQTGGSFSSVEALKEWTPMTVYNHLRSHMPYFVSLIEAFIKDKKGAGENKEDDIPMTVSVIGSILWIKRSQKANYFAKGFATYLYASGVHAATINVLNRCGLSVSYTTLIASLESLNASCVDRFRSVAARCRSFFMWDNVNFPSNVAEQRLRNAGSFDSGTASTLVGLHPPPGRGPEAIDEALNLDKYIESIENAPDLTLSDIMLTAEDGERLRQAFSFEAINVLSEHGGDAFRGYRKRKFVAYSSEIVYSHLTHTVNKASQPLIEPLLPLRVTEAYPLPTLHIEQASASGNVTVTEELRRITEIDKSELFRQRLCVATGDLLTVSRILSVRDVRTIYMRTPVHIEDKHENLSYLVPFCGLFHTRIAAVTAILQTHFGKPNARPSDAPASLWRHNEVLKRKNVAINQSVNYRTVQDLTFHSLYARLLDVIRIESGCESLQVFGSQLSSIPKEQAWDRLQLVVLNTVTRFTSPEEAGTDDVLRNSILFIRDALLFRCFVSSVKCGNMALIDLILKVWTISFRGSGRSQYANELMRLRHNIVHAWPKPLRDLILSNMLVNMTGNKNGWKETDLLQEHINYWIKVIYKARGSNASWTWLEEISSCVTTLRQLADEVNGSFASSNSTHHTIPNLQADLDTLLKSLTEEKIHIRNVSRVYTDKALRAKDALVMGLQSLEGPTSPIEKFNKDRFGARKPMARTNRTSDNGADTTGATQPGSADANGDDSLFEVVITDEAGDVEVPFGIS